MNRESKTQEISSLADKFNRANAAFLIDFKGMTVEEVTRFRKALQPTKSEMKVVRNTLVRRALQDFPKDLKVLDNDLVGNNAVVFAYGDVSSTAKAISDFAKDVEKMQFKAGSMDGSAIKEDKLQVLARLPSLPVLQAQFLGLLQQPASKFLGVLTAVPRDFLSVLDQYRKTKVEA